MRLFIWIFHLLRRSFLFLHRFYLYVLGKRISGARFLDMLDVEAILNSHNQGLLIDGKSKRLSLKQSFEHVVVVARSGGGKTSRYIIPNLLTLDHCSIVVTDPSGEIHQKTSGYLQRKGYAVQVLNLDNPSQSLCYNPLAKARTVLEMTEVAHILIRSANPDYEKSPFWYGGAEIILDVLIKCLRETGKPEQHNLRTVLTLLQQFGEHGEGLTDFVARYGDENTVNQFKGFLTGNKEGIQSFILTALNSLRMLNNPDIAALLSKDEIDFSQLRRCKTALFVILPSRKKSLYRFIVNLFYTQFFAACMERIPTNNDLPIHVLYDEFGHSSIPEFEDIITEIRKYRVSISMILQEYSQLKKHYGESGVKTILGGGTGSKLFYSGIDLDMAKIVEGMLGKVKIEYRLNTGERASKEENLMNADRIRTMKDDNAIFITANKEPIMLKTKPYFQQRIKKRLNK